MIILKHASLIICILSLLLCMAAPLKKSAPARQYPIISRLLAPHIFYAFLLLVSGLIHGILSGRNPGMITGKAAWLFLFILVLTSLFKKFMPRPRFLWLHRVMSVILGVLIMVHIAYAVLN